MAPLLNGDILDFGCGSKPYQSLFINARNYIGIDIETSGHNHNDSKVDIYYDGKEIPFPDNYFDGVVCFEVLEHVFNIDVILAEIRRVIKPGGNFLLSIPFAWDEHEVPYDFARYTSFGITHLLSRNGFSVMNLEKTTTYFLAVNQMFIAYLVQHVLPKGRLIGRISQLFIVFPLTLMAIAMNIIMPKRFDYFCDSVILCQKIAD